MSHQKIRKAVFPVAGLGTRFLPATKSIPKEMMTLVDRPLIQYAVDEARAAGIEEFIFVTSRGKSALEDYFDHAPHLENSLRLAEKTDLLRTLAETDMRPGAIAYVRQDRPLGLGHAVWCAKRLIGDEPFAVILPDDVIAADKPCLQQMVEAHAETGGCMIAVMEVQPSQISSYGVIDVAEDQGKVLRVRDLVEKPRLNPPSNLAVVGRYILTPQVLDRLEKARTGAGGEVQLTDAIADEARAGSPVFGMRFDGMRYDCGSKAGALQAMVAFGLARQELHHEFAAFLNRTVALNRAAE
ncbi:MAG: UTP--glucose-1-phosphate uridylyltransferase [Gemmobacter sp.]|jgi:UTP--glucose-1-phosphate uridylyltransferase|nr:UTP--glucose-1-phosphate uridylyltransferase [Gemmobacter sp.]